ncbi:MAG: glycosyltransferase family 9 protein [Candidatus Acidiferrales bacterium]
MTIGLVGLSKKEAETAARGCLVKFSKGRRFVIRLAELLLFPVVRCVDFFRSRAEIASDEIRKILVLEPGNLGDIVGILPFLKNLRISYPEARIALLANPSMFPLLGNLPLVDELIPIRFPWSVHFSQWRRYNPFSSQWIELARVLRDVRRRDFDLALSGRGDIRDNLVLWLTGIKRRVGYGFLGGGFLMTETAMPDLSRLHRSDCWLQLLEHLGKEVLDRQPRLQLSPTEIQFAKEYLSGLGIEDGELVVGIHPGARIRVRQWGTENFRAVGEKLAAVNPAKILWFHDPKENVPSGLPTAFVPVALPLRQFMAILARCNLLICNDSGPMHIATGLGVPIVGIFGATEPAWFGPLGEPNKIVIQSGFWCRPCNDRCIFDQPYCLRTISIEQVFQAALDLSAGGLPVPPPVVVNQRQAE